MTSRPISDARVAQLRAQEADRAAAVRARRARAVQRESLRDQPSQRGRTVVERVGYRRAVLVLASGGTVRDAAETILDALPADPRAMEHRRVLLAEATGRAS